jgi:hypothetical protein
VRSVAGFDLWEESDGEYNEWLEGFAWRLEESSDWQAIDSNCELPPTLAPAATATVEVWGNLVPLVVRGKVSREHSVWTLAAEWTARLVKVEYIDETQVATYKVELD